ncbi:Phosphotransferase enzyme family protein [Rosistilla carotiformis]|uniref:Phosphotransferase enzyme family protein n=1 Tax=Rosistilla carotiformis TaxID=2528017 RepID=A0A518K1B2_9BACT|nr:aminoglycoside phosphotransferase family protein [Rosistilla carotiformis]QDV71577.1 Phosphotransferase enzyme family protein [Rosistilla carotiformis]
MNEIPASILHQLLAPRGATQIEPAASGWGLSGARVYRVEVDGTSYCLRRWPLGTEIARVDQVHRFMTAARSGGCVLVPEVGCQPGAPARIVSDNGVWDLTRWMPGRCLSRDELSVERIEQAAAAIASIHRSLAAVDCQDQVAPAVLARITRIDQLLQDNPFARALASPPPLQSLAHRATALWNANHLSIRYRLHEATAVGVKTQWVLRDVHLEHLLFDNLGSATESVSAIVDYDAVRIDTPATDLARFLGSCGGIPLQWYNAAIAAYRRIQPLDATSERLIPLLDAATCLIASANWTQWLCVENRRFDAGAEKAADRFREAVDRAEMLFP